MIAFWCECGADLRLEESEVGGVVECPECGEELEVPNAPFREEAKRVCPVCGTRRWQKITSRRAFRKKMPGFPTWQPDRGAEEYNTAFFFSLPRECRECGTIWLPPAPSWAILFLMGLGALLAGGALAELCDLLPLVGRAKLPLPLLGAGVAGGLGLVGYGVHALRGAKGKAVLLRIGTGN